MTEPADPGDHDRQRPVLTARTRIIMWMIATTALGLLVLIIGVDRALQADIATKANQDIAQEIAEFGQFVKEGRDPATAQPFASTRRTFEVFLSRQQPGEGEWVAGLIGPGSTPGNTTGNTPGNTATRPDTLVTTGAIGASIADYDPLDDPALMAAVASDRRSGVHPTATGEVRWGTVAVDSTGDAGGRLLVAIHTGPQVERAQATVRRISWIGVGTLALTTLASWLAAGQILRPLRTMRTTAAEISEKDLTRRLPVHGNDDIAAVARTFNGLLDRLEAAFLTQQRFVDDAGHELRTPITIVRGHLELMGDDPQEREQTLALVTTELDRMGRIVADMLLLAKAERPDYIRPEPTNLADLTIDIDAKVAALGDRQWVLGHVAEGVASVDAERVTQAVIQLAQNAVQHTHDGAQITLASRLVREDDGGPAVWFTVQDTGPGVRPSEQDRIFQRFARGSAQRSPAGTRAGAGLGLAIVATIAEGHGGRTTLTSQPGVGSEFGLILPLPDLTETVESAEVP
ncbi:sensor histidine kinase [Kribbia dieselivorans]|uniref:sensor histidine kinase n=1 Tax=Kribbia dieselivorans TaxID=331526 RepID=UPI0008385673|nr:HAMP domain-containing sensor histidine kinase [Kribbia dieselivorans]